jgi:hypothetical protein
MSDQFVRTDQGRKGGTLAVASFSGAPFPLSPLPELQFAEGRTLTMANNQQPAYRAYSVVKREGQDDFWLPIGAAFEHADGGGFNVILQALPIDGKLVLRIPKDEDRPAEQPVRQRSAGERKKPAIEAGRLPRIGNP